MDITRLLCWPFKKITPHPTFFFFFRMKENVVSILTCVNEHLESTGELKHSHTISPQVEKAKICISLSCSWFALDILRPKLQNHSLLTINLMLSVIYGESVCKISKPYSP